MADLPVPTILAIATALVLGCCFILLFYKQKTPPPTKPVKRKDTTDASVANGEADAGKPSVRLLFGTQTGTAERFAKQLGGELRKRYGASIVVDILDIENYKAAERLVKETLVLFLMATYGDGEPTDNAADFCNWLATEAEACSDGSKELLLKGVHYGVFGLGNKQYEHFCAVGKKIFKQMKEIGGESIVRRGDGDDDDDIDGDFDKWCADFFEALDQHPQLLGQHSMANGNHVDEVIPAYNTDILPDGTKEVPAFRSSTGLDGHHPFMATITEVRELHTAESDRSCVHVEVSIDRSDIKYEHGDHIAVYAANPPGVVEQAAALLGIPLNTVFKLSKPAGADGSLPEPLPGPLTLRTALASFADLLNSPHREALAALASCASNPDEAARLRKLSSLNGKQEYSEFIQQPHRSLLEVMAAFPSAKPPLGLFFAAVAPRLQPRYYSISSSPKQHPKHVHITCAVVRDVMPTGRVHEGVASTFLKRAAVGTQVAVHVRHSTFRLPAQPGTPVVMVGPGTGLAPFRGFLQERAALKQSGAVLGDAHLFFGCRNRRHDFIYEAELQQSVVAGALSHLHVAFSREKDVKEYVQHHLERQAETIWQLLGSQGAHLYVCGDAKHMAKDVHHTLIGIVQKAKGCSGTQAETWVKEELQNAGRYLRDVW